MKIHDTDRGTNRPSATGNRSGQTEPSGLSTVEKSETIADHVDLDQIGSELPDAWTVGPDHVQTDAEPLAETLLFRRSLADPQLALKPADPAKPRENIEFYERSGPRSASRRTTTVERLAEAVRVAVNRIHQYQHRFDG